MEEEEVKIEEGQQKPGGYRKVFMACFLVVATGLFTYLIPTAEPKLFENVVLYIVGFFFSANAVEHIPAVSEAISKVGRKVFKK